MIYGNAQGQTSIRSNAVYRVCARYRPNKPASSSGCLPHLCQNYLPTCSPIARFTVSCGRQPTPLRIHHSGHLPLVRPHPALLAPTHRALQPRLSLLAPAVPPAARPPTPSGVPPTSIGAGGAVARLRSVPTSQGHPRARPVLVVPVRCRSASAPTPRPESTGPGLSLPLCYKYMFQVFQILSQVFHMDVVKVDRNVAYVASVSDACCKCFRGILQAFVQNISSVSDVCCKYFFIWMLQLFHTYVARVCSKCFSRFNLMLK
jgi:hypothetical protein